MMFLVFLVCVDQARTSWEFTSRKRALEFDSPQTKVVKGGILPSFVYLPY